MTHELKLILEQAVALQKKGLRNVLATVVALNGSSYRKPGVRMLISENGQMIGAVSGGCVERDIAQEAQSVFKDGIPKIMTYDGRYRLGCEGLLFILIEPLVISKDFMETFAHCLKARQPIKMTSYFEKKEGSSSDFGTLVALHTDGEFALRQSNVPKAQAQLQVFQQQMDPCFRLFIFGGEHDAVKLCSMASLLGWEVHVITSIKDPKTPADFPGAASVTAQTPELLTPEIDADTAVTYEP